MFKICAYLSFRGNCREAMMFYQHCLGGELSFQTVGESPMATQLPHIIQDFILHAMLITKDFALMASDMTPESGLLNGNALSLMLHCQEEEALYSAFYQLSKGGIVKQAIEETHWGALLGEIIDKYGHHWILNFNRNKTLQTT